MKEIRFKPSAFVDSRTVGQSASQTNEYIIDRHGRPRLLLPGANQLYPKLIIAIAGASSFSFKSNDSWYYMVSGVLQLIDMHLFNGNCPIKTPAKHLKCSRAH